LVPVGEPDEDDEAALAFDERGDGAHRFAEEHVAFPVPRDGTVVGLGGSLADVDRSPELALAGHHRMPPRPASGVPPTQVAGQLPAQRAAGLHKQRQVDRLVRHPHLRIVREGSSEPTRDLLR
jgi:hypothetical protein